MKKKLKIFFLAPGNSVHSFRWIKKFSSNNKVYWHYTGKLNYKLNGINLQKLPDGLLLLVSPFIFLLNIILVKPDIIHVHSISKNLFISLFAVFFYKKKVILNPWGSDFFFPNLLVKFLQLFINKNIIFTDSFIIKNKLEKKNKVYKINFGVNLSYFKQKKIKKLYKTKNLIFCPRGYNPIYNQMLILKFIKINKKKLKNFIFIFSGMIDDLEFNNIKVYTNKYKLTNMVELYGSLNKDLYTRYLREAFLVISASKSDAGLSSSIAEAMSCESIVMCTNNRDNPYWIKHGSNGFLFKNNSIKDFSKQFFKICNLSKMKKNLIKKSARKIQLENNDLNIEMEKVKKIYRSIYMRNI